MGKTKQVLVGIIAFIVLFGIYAVGQEPGAITGLVTANNTAYSDLFKAVGLDAEAEPATPPVQSEPIIQPTFQTQQLTPQATVEVDSCFNASDVAGSGDTIIVNVSTITALSGPHCANLNLSNITFDCNGSKLTTIALGVIGINISAPNVTVQNCNLELFDRGIKIGASAGNTDNVVIKDSNMTNNKVSGILFSGAASQDIVVENVTFDSNTGDGITVKGSFTNLVIKDNRFKDNSFADIDFRDGSGDGRSVLRNIFSKTNPTTKPIIGLGNNSNMLIENNTFENYTNTHFFNSTIQANSFGFGTVSDNLTLRGNTFNNISCLSTIQIRRVGNVTVENNRFLRIVKTFSPGTGYVPDIVVSSVSEALVRNNTLNGTLQISSSTDMIIEANTILDRDNATSPRRGITGSSLYNVTVRNHENIPNSISIDGINVTITNNTANGNGEFESSGTNITISYNTLSPVAIESGSSAGITILGTGFGRVINNTFANGASATINIEGANKSVSGNVVENLTGDAFIVTAVDTVLFNNRIYNITGTGFRVNATNVTIRDNNMTYVIRDANTSFNTRGLSTPQIPISAEAILVEDGSDINITRNFISSQNPQGLVNGIFGVRTTNVREIWTDDNDFQNIRTAVDYYNTQDSTINNNTMTNAEHKALVLDDSTNVTIEDNSIAAPGAPSQDPYKFKTGMYIFRSDRNVMGNNTITDYHIGLHMYNSTQNRWHDGSITGIATEGIGIFAYLSNDNNYTDITITQKEYGVKLLESNLSNFTNTNVSSSIYGYSLFRSHNNYIGNCDASGNTIGLDLDLFSSSNTVDNNDFSGSADVDLLFDMFATGNTGTGNTFGSIRSENGASGNVIT